MNLSKNYPLPVFALLDGDNHLGEQLLERTVILHTPTGTLLEVLAIEPKEVKKFEAIDHLPFVFTNVDGDDEHHVLLVHSYNAAVELQDVLNDAAKWYGNYANWIDGEIDNL